MDAEDKTRLVCAKEYLIANGILGVSMSNSADEDIMDTAWIEQLSHWMAGYHDFKTANEVCENCKWFKNTRIQFENWTCNKCNVFVKMNEKFGCNQFEAKP